MVVVSSLGARCRRLVADQQEQTHGDGEEGDELGVAAGHAVPFAVHADGALLLEEALKDEVESLAGQLACEEQGDLDLAGRPDQGDVDYAETLRDQSEPGAEVGEGVGRVLRNSWQREAGVSRCVLL